MHGLFPFERHKDFHNRIPPAIAEEGESASWAPSRHVEVLGDEGEESAPEEGHKRTVASP